MSICEPFTEADHLQAIKDSRNTLVAYAKKRVEDAVIAPLRVNSADYATLHHAQQILDGLRAHFAKHWIVIGDIRAETGEITVAVGPYSGGIYQVTSMGPQP
jgi:hypothetical protein